MNDQAAELRNLVLRSRRFNAAIAGPEPRLVVLTGGKGGVGTTSLALNLAIAMSQNGSRTVLVDADLYRADTAVMCGISEQGSVADVLKGRQDIHEVLQMGPGGIQLVPGVWGGDTEDQVLTKSPQRLTSQLKTLGRFADVVILDSGGRASETVKAFWQAANDVVVVTTPDPVAVMDSYATLKTLGGKSAAAIHLLVNRCPNSQVAEDVHRRIDQSCQRFLKTSINQVGHVPTDELMAESAERSHPLLVYAPSAQVSVRIQQIASTLLQSEKRAASREVATATG